MKILSDKEDDEFNNNVLKNIVYNHLKEEATEKSRSDSYKKMDKYINTVFSMSIDDIVNGIRDNICVNKNGEVYVISLDMCNNDFVDCVYTVDFGTLDVKGLHLVDHVFRYINDNIDELYDMYVEGVDIYGN